VPFEIPEFTLLGRLDSIPQLLQGAAWEPSVERPARDVTAEMPLENMVLELN
jgi:hypothetical protein